MAPMMKGSFSLIYEVQSKRTLLPHLYSLRDEKLWVKSNKRISYLNIPCAFDIETTSTYINGNKVAFMYEWTLGIKDRTFVGRTWDDFENVLTNIVNALSLNENRRIIIYVQNLSFEFSFIMKRFKWLKVFALKERNPIQCVDFRGIEFRCSLALSGYSLAKIGENLVKYKVKKMVGDLDYSLVRHSNTPLTERELQYCINDVLVILAYIQEKIESDGDITKIPLTKTGYVRKFCRKKCLYTDGNHRGDDKFTEYRALMDETRLTVDEYLIAKRAFHGGFTHANAFYEGDTLTDICSYDFTSSYPAVMCSEKFPMSKGRYIKNPTEEEFLLHCEKDLAIFDIEFVNIESSARAENPISSSKCFEKRGKYVENNGRIYSADYIKISLTNIDFVTIYKYYHWDKMRVSNFWWYRKKYLPKAIIESVLELYAKKTTLKGVEGKENEYMNSKEMCNAMFGMCVTDICRDEFIYNVDGWSKEKPPIENAIEKYNNSKNRFLSYLWGIFITAYAQKNLFEGITEFETDYVYSDTDSVKGKNRERHMKFIEDYNLKIRSKLEKMCEKCGIDKSLLSPKTIKGISKPLGVWEYEGTYSRFKTLGAKRYMTEKDGTISMTVSGVNKNNAIPYLLKKYGEEKIFNAFDEDLYIPSTCGEIVAYNAEGIAINNPTGKSTHTYIDEEMCGSIVDYLGNRGSFHELSGVHLEPCDYSFSIAESYADFIKGVKDIFK